MPLWKKMRMTEWPKKHFGTWASMRRTEDKVDRQLALTESGPECLVGRQRRLTKKSIPVRHPVRTKIDWANTCPIDKTLPNMGSLKQPGAYWAHAAPRKTQPGRAKGSGIPQESIAYSVSGPQVLLACCTGGQTMPVDRIRDDAAGISTSDIRGSGQLTAILMPPMTPTLRNASCDVDGTNQLYTCSRLSLA